VPAIAPAPEGVGIRAKRQGPTPPSKSTPVRQVPAPKRRPVPEAPSWRKPAQAPGNDAARACERDEAPAAGSSGAGDEPDYGI
jgi:hypothetical protein